MLKTTTIQISVRHIKFMEEWIYESQINTIEDLAFISDILGSKAKYKKVTDKNWYSLKTMVKRLCESGYFKNDLPDSFRIVKRNELNK